MPHTPSRMTCRHCAPKHVAKRPVGHESLSKTSLLSKLHEMEELVKELRGTLETERAQGCTRCTSTGPDTGQMAAGSTPHTTTGSQQAADVMMSELFAET